MLRLRNSGFVEMGFVKNNAQELLLHWIWKHPKVAACVTTCSLAELRLRFASELSSLVASTNKKLSAILVCRLFRNSTGKIEVSAVSGQSEGALLITVLVLMH